MNPAPQPPPPSSKFQEEEKSEREIPDGFTVSGFKNLIIGLNIKVKGKFVKAQKELHHSPFIKWV